ncbi:MAG: MBL fold metallo-hydrolase [Atribacterota bacterium]|nr:MBL fold metallo-hydrolase [Atribacterota bacterium]
MEKKKVIIKKLILGPLSTNCYFLVCSKTKELAVIDPAEKNDKIIEVIEKNRFKLKYIINTHGHADHIAGNELLKSRYKSILAIHRMDSNMLLDIQENLSFFTGNLIVSPPADRQLMNEDIIKIGQLSILIIHTPGHSPGSIILKVDKYLFTGDTLFANGIGRTDLPGGSDEQMIHSIKEKITVLDRNYIILPGHGPISKLNYELKNNPWLQ